LWRDENLIRIAKSVRVPNVLILASSSDAWRPIAHQIPIYNQIRSGFKVNGGVCKTAIQINGGNHCFFVDLPRNTNNTNSNVSECYQKEIEFASFKQGNVFMSHEYQLTHFGAPLLIEYIQWISNNITNQTSTKFQQYLYSKSKSNSSQSQPEINYLQSCYVFDEQSQEYVLFSHQAYVPPPSQELDVYRSVTYNVN
jgi:hypothetical protein